MYTTPKPCCYHAHSESCTCRASSSLVGLETSVRNALKMTAPQSRFFRDMETERERILRCLIANDDGKLEGRIVRVSRCCAYPRVIATEFGEPVLSVGRCKDRMCPRCSRHNAWQMSEKLNTIMSRMTSCRMITLTLKHRRGSLKGQIDRLMLGWRKMRKTLTWRDHVEGGIYSLEVTYDEVNRTWHPHLHILTQGTFFDQKMLSGLWKTVTGDSPVVDIRAVKSKKHVAKYVSKYVTKPDEVATWDDDVLWEYMQAIRGRRLFHTFGCLHNISVKDEKRTIKEKIGRGYASIGVLCRRLTSGCEHAAMLFAYLQHAPKTWRLAFNIEDLTPGLKMSECNSMDNATLDDLLWNATYAIERPPPPPPKKKPRPGLFDDLPFVSTTPQYRH